MDVIKAIDQDFILFQARELLYWENSLKFWKNEKRRNRKAEDAEYLAAQVKYCEDKLKAEASVFTQRLTA